MRAALLNPSLAILMLLVVSTSGRADDATKELASPNFEEHVKPILRQYCLKCHGEDMQEADLNMQAYASLLRGGSGGKIVEAGRSSQSVIIQLISTDDADLRMPPNSPPLPAEKIALIAKWIDSGLKETSKSVSMVERRDLTFKPSGDASAKPEGPPAMPENLETVTLPKVVRPLPIISLHASPWAPLLAVSGQEHVQLLNIDTQEELGNIAFPEGEPNVIRFSRNGAVLMVAGGRPVQSGRVVLFDVRSGHRIAEIGDELDSVLAADLSPDQQLVALGGTGRVVKVYSTTDGKLQYRLDKHTDWITAARFSPDGTKLATADRAGGLHLWDAKGGGILLNLPEHKSTIHGLDWRSDSRLLASVGEDGNIVWWDTTDGFPAINKPNAHPPKRPSGAYGTIPNGVLSCSFDPAGNLVTTGRDGFVRLWSPDGSPKKSWKIDVSTPISSAASHTGAIVISGDTAGNVKFFEADK